MFAEAGAIADVVEDLARRATGRPPTRTDRVQRQARARGDALQAVRQAFVEPTRLLGVLRADPRHATEQLLELAGFYDQRGDKRRCWAVELVRARGAAAPVMLAVVLGDIARDAGVESIGAVLRRRLPRLASNKPAAALSHRGPKSLGEVLAHFRESAGGKGAA